MSQMKTSSGTDAREPTEGSQRLKKVIGNDMFEERKRSTMRRPARERGGVERARWKGRGDGERARVSDDETVINLAEAGMRG